MQVRIKGGKRKSKNPYGDPYYVVVRLDVKNPNPLIPEHYREVFAYINYYWMKQPLVTEGEIRDVIIEDMSLKKIRWKCYDINGRTVDYKDILTFA